MSLLYPHTATLKSHRQEKLLFRNPLHWIFRFEVIVHKSFYFLNPELWQFPSAILAPFGVGQEFEVIDHVVIQKTVSTQDAPWFANIPQKVDATTDSARRHK